MPQQLSTRTNPQPVLTRAEERVLRLISQSKTNREIASALGISPATVKRHIENILRKLQFRNRVEAAIYGLSLSGCPFAGKADCPLEVWQRRVRTFRKDGPCGR
jgi:DNA-binding CsgD family transcriptional regulator